MHSHSSEVLAVALADLAPSPRLLSTVRLLSLLADTSFHLLTSIALRISVMFHLLLASRRRGCKCTYSCLPTLRLSSALSPWWEVGSAQGCLEAEPSALSFE